MAMNLEKIYLRLSVIVFIKKIITPGIIQSQKTSHSLGNLYIDNCKFGN